MCVSSYLEISKGSFDGGLGEIVKFHDRVITGSKDETVGVEVTVRNGLQKQGKEKGKESWISQVTFGISNPVDSAHSLKITYLSLAHWTKKPFVLLSKKKGIDIRAISFSLEVALTVEWS